MNQVFMTAQPVLSDNYIGNQTVRRLVNKEPDQGALADPKVWLSAKAAGSPAHPWKD